MRNLIACALLALGAGLAPPAAATTVVQVDVPTMTRTSEWVVRAHVERVEPVDLRGRGGSLATDVTLVVRDVYRGRDVPSRYVLRLPGGEGADGMTMRVPGMPRFARGEDVVLFLERTPTGHVPCGLGQGVWRVVTDATGRTWVRQSPSGVHVVRRDDRGRLVEAPPRLFSDARPLWDLVAQIQAARRP
ncbi:MAG: hypothetical protein ACQEXJ_07615 [Myxococcota bacterium]